MAGGMPVRWLAEALAIVLVCAAVMSASRDYVLVAVSGGSMAPTLRPGDLCIVRRGGSVPVGSIALFSRDGGHSQVLHRIVRRTGDTYVTRGDANPVSDFEPTGASEVRGHVVAFLPVGTAVDGWRRFRTDATLRLQSHMSRR